jgi:hypothetical protein
LQELQALGNLGNQRESRKLQKRSEDILAETNRKKRSADVVSLTDLRK